MPAWTPTVTELPPSPDALAIRAQRHLEWQRLADAVIARCQCEATRRRGVPIESTVAASRSALAQTSEVIALLDLGQALPLDEFRDLDLQLKRLSRKGALDGPALADVRFTLRCCRATRRFLRARRPTTAALNEVCHLDPTLDDLEDVLGASIELDGTLLDHASPTLRKLRTEVANLRARIVARLEQIIDKHRDLLSDKYYTLREDRFVVPVRTDAHERFQGIVHSTSDSGASLFVEPAAIVNQGNRLKMAQAELHREELRILAELSARVAEQQPALSSAMETLCRLDLRQAGAKLAQPLGAHVPELGDGTQLRLRSARHPLLALEGGTVVGNDLALEPGQGLVLSGPNAGGKTVLLKTLGLFALMARAGLPLPCGDGSVMGFFDTVLTDLGDEQSTQQNLSTFSAHVRSLARIVDTGSHGSLVLLDELCGGTDPQEGAALACAIAARLVAQGCTVLLTTHYEQLKAYALQAPEMRSASVGFDLDTMQPSFALQMDIPGASSALAVASRFGIPPSVTAHASELIPQQAKDFEALVADLGRQSEGLRRARADLKSAEERAQALNTEAELRLEKLKARSQRKLTEEAEQVLAELRQTRAMLRATRTKAKAADRDTLRTLEKQVQTAGARLAVGGDLSQAALPQASDHPGVPPSDLSEGDTVQVPHLRSDATVLELDPKGRVRVAAGSLKLWLNQSQLRPKTAERPAQPATRVVEPRQAAQGRTSDNTVSLRGMRVDDALPMMEAFIDRLRMGSARRGYVDHGHGSGALRSAVRQHLRTVVAHIQEVRPGNDDEGGDSVTSFLLKE